MTEDKLRINIPTSSQKLHQNFPDDPKGDIQIRIKQGLYKLSKAHLRLQSNYFKKILTADLSYLQIKQDFNQLAFNNILQCFYGATVQIKRKDVLQYFPIVQYLQIESLINLFCQDMVIHTSQYGLFKLFNIAYNYCNQKLFQKCLLELQFHNFIQIKTQKLDVMKISIQLFKLIIKTHNKLPRQKRIFDVYQIRNLINQYTTYKKMSSLEKSNLKFYLIDKTNLNSYQYRDIFLNDSNTPLGYHTAPKKFQTRALSLNTIKNENDFNSFITNHSMRLLTQKKLYLEMDTTFQRKISNQLQQQNQQLCNQIQNLTIISQNQNQKCKIIKQQFDNLRKKINQKTQQNFYSDKIKSIDNSLSEFNKNLLNQSQRLNNLMKSTQELIEKYDQNDKLNESQDSCSSSLLNLNGQNQKFTQFVTIKNNQLKNNQKVIANNKSNTNKSNTSIVSKSQYQIRDTGRQYKQKSQANVSVSSFTGQGQYKRDKGQSLTPDNKSVKQKGGQRIQQKDNTNNKDQKNKQNKSSLNFSSVAVQFDKQTKIIKTQKQLQILSSIFPCTQRFIKKRFKFIYRAQRPNKKIIKYKSSLEIARQIKQQLEYRQNIMIIFRTERDKLIGGFYTSCVSFLSLCDVYDQNAFIFSITEGKKYPIKSQNKAEAMMIDDGYIICFGFDLMISESIFEPQNYCSWPDRYCGQKNMKQRGCEWFAGQSQFGIKEIQIWEVQQDGGDMVI